MRSGKTKIQLNKFENHNVCWSHKIIISSINLSRFNSCHKRFPVYSIARVRLDRDNLLGVNDIMHPSSPHKSIALNFSPEAINWPFILTCYMTGSQIFLLTGLEWHLKKTGTSPFSCRQEFESYAPYRILSNTDNIWDFFIFSLSYFTNIIITIKLWFKELNW